LRPGLIPARGGFSLRALTDGPPAVTCNSPLANTEVYAYGQRLKHPVLFWATTILPMVLLLGGICGALVYVVFHHNLFLAILAGIIGGVILTVVGIVVYYGAMLRYLSKIESPETDELTGLIRVMKWFSQHIYVELPPER
jgi:hypothetical protein